MRYRNAYRSGRRSLVTAQYARLHLAAYVAQGWTFGALAAAIGVSLDTVSKVIKQPDAKISRDTEAKMLALDALGTLPTKTATGGAEPFVLKVGAVRRIQALLVMGWPHEEMQRRCGVSTQGVLWHGGMYVRRSTHDKIAVMYRRLSRIPGPSPVTRGRALTQGLLSPVFWDDIDHDLEPDDFNWVVHEPVDLPVFTRVAGESAFGEAS
jgi:hypothetical protein